MLCCWVHFKTFWLRLLHSKFASKVRMPRKQAKLIPFFKNGLDFHKYINLKYEDVTKEICSLYLPHKTNRLEKKVQYIFKDWYTANNRNYTFLVDYTNARQAMTAAIRKSDYVQLIEVRDNKLIFRILKEEEVKEKKQKKRESKMLKGNKEGDDTSEVESGYESGVASPESCMDYEQNDKNLLQGIVHDHAYVFSPQDGESAKGGYIHFDIEDVSNATMIFDETAETFGTSMLLEQDNSSGIKSSLEDSCLMEAFSDIPALPGDVTLSDLDKITIGELIRSDNELELALQVYDSVNAEANMGKKLYVCKVYVQIDESVLLIYKLFQDIDVEIADTPSNIRIVLDEAVQRGIQGFTGLKMWKKVDDHYLMVLLERQSLNH